MDDGLWITGPDTKENVICDLVGRNSRYQFTAEDEANAAFIVTACNAHDALAAACTELLDALEASTYDREWVDLKEQARAALALAEPQEAVR